ncbi:MAG: TIGR00159 family protein [Candidatus Amoebophilus sp. 36-38]|nr:MAG: TIGR00159 family protein [Candidatus Amoebophilus sp. 36-38]
MIAFNLAWPTIKIVDIIDILLVSLLLYQLYKLVKGSAAIKIILGALILYLIAWIAHRSNMQLLSYLLGQLSGVTVLATIILFQYEIRKFLSTLGGIFFWGNKQLSIRIPGWKKKTDLAFNITAIVEASKMLGGSNTGGLIVLSNNEDLKFYIESGDLLHAYVSKRLLLAILHRESPLHDGAVIIYQSKIVAARCILPVTEKQNLPAQFGLRHRAAIGMSEVTDTLVVVISEETGQISVAQNGILQHNLSVQELRIAINEYLRGE